jgi:hypothetical protein
MLKNEKEEARMTKMEEALNVKHVKNLTSHNLP